MLELLAPDEMVAKVSDIDLDALARRGVRGLVLDVDNTLVSWGTVDLSPEVERWSLEARRRFAICLMSNSVRGKRMRRVAEMLDVPGLSA